MYFYYVAIWIFGFFSVAMESQNCDAENEHRVGEGENQGIHCPTKLTSLKHVCSKFFWLCACMVAQVFVYSYIRVEVYMFKPFFFTVIFSRKHQEVNLLTR